MLSDTLAIQTPRLLLRLLATDDRDEFIRVHACSAELYRPWLPARDPDESLETLFERELARANRGRVDGLHARLVAVLPTGSIAGFFNLSEIVRGAFQNAYASWCVNAEVARQGYATEAVQAMLNLAFAPREAGGIGLHRVQANIIPENAPSLRLAERVGFRYEGIAERYLRIAGAWRDHRMYARTAEEHAFVHLVSEPG